MSVSPAFSLRRAVAADAACLGALAGYVFLDTYADRGIGRALRARAEHDARARDAASIWLTAWVGNSAALAFYAALGWRDVGSTPHVFEGASYENRILVKSLSP